MGRDTYATYADTLNVQVIDRKADPAYMNPQVIQQRTAAGKMLLECAVSAQYGSKWEGQVTIPVTADTAQFVTAAEEASGLVLQGYTISYNCLLYTSDAADDLLCVDLGGRRIIKKKKKSSNTQDHR
eukprot:TRINITY_DN5934_c0_g1_i1.p1 TRINITY_DN5934_c0_g1~~TRINITY_DN5934_c0_g1_i1.p1  ORF type:complete len:127 (-),score=50.91 TRINITY_DN5934_c0_g1_i1:38-418(-)